MRSGAIDRAILSAMVLAMSAGLASGAGAGNAAADERDNCLGCNPGLAFFDIRLDPIEHASEAVCQHLAALRASPAAARRQAAIERLSGRVQMLKVDDDVAFGTPQFARSPAQFLTGPSNAAPTAIVYSFADEFTDLLELNGAALRAYPLTRDFETHGGMMHHLTWQQQINGVDVFGCELRANISRRGELMNVGSSIIPEPADGWSVPAPVLGELEAIRAAAANAGIVVTQDPTPQGTASYNGAQVWSQAPGFGNQDPIETKMVYFAKTRDTVVPAWTVSIPEPGVGNTYDMVVDATDGTVLWRHNRLVWDTTQPATYRVYTSDSPAPGSPGRNTPDGVQFPFVSRSLVTVTPAEISPFSPNGWIPDGQTATVGNNVDAYLDAANDNTASAADRATGVSRVFDFPMNVGLNTGDAPTAYQPAATTQLFYFANRYHDRLYALGFDEVAGNFQTSNFGRGGTQGDPVRAESQDGSGTNNANFSTTGTDGSTGRCQMYVWTGPNPDRDGSFDGDIVYHEMSHGLSIRLHRGGLTGSQAGGMGEGWSDFFGLCLNAQAGDDFGAVYAAGAYATYNISAGFANNYYFGIRRFPYSPDMNKSPLTFADIDNGQFGYDNSVPKGPIGSSSANEVHNTGEIWCNTLLEARREIGVTEGFAANNIMMQLAVDGMKLAPAVPDFLDERDAILQADLNRYGGVHQLAIWRAFAKRGMGVSATSPSGGGTAGVVEAFDTPQRIDFAYPDGLPVQFSPTDATSFRVTLTPVDVTITPGSPTIWYAAGGGSFVSAPLSLISGTTYRATVPATPCFTDVSFYITANTEVGVRSDPAGAESAPYHRTSLTQTVVVFSDDMETNRGWTGGQPGDTATAGQWERADPAQTIAQPGDDHTPAPGVRCWVTGAAAGSSDGAFDVDGGYTTLLSPVFDLTGQADAVISYWRWYSNNLGGAPGADTFRVQISNNNGATWSTFETVGPTGAGTTGGWVNFSRRVGDAIVPTSTVRMRFIAEDAGTGSLIEAAIDDFSIIRSVCEPPVACPADFNQDGGVDGADVDAFFAAWEAGDGSADVNADGGVDGADVDTFFAAWEAGGC